MTTPSDPKTPSELESSTPSREAAAPKTSKRVYAAPRLRHLGSVRELTLGGTMGLGDGMGGRQAM